MLNPQPAVTKPPANYKLTPSPTRSILRQNDITKKSNFRVSFDLELTPEPKLAPKFSNPSMPDLSKLMKEAEEASEETEPQKNPFLDPAFKIPPNETVKLGEAFFTNLFLLNTNDKPTTFTDPWSATKKVSSTPKAPATPASANSVLTPVNRSVESTNTGSVSKGLEQGQKSVQQDKYSALKELDEIFKSTVVLSDGKSTGTSIFGSSPMASQQPEPSPVMSTSVFGPSPTLGGSSQNGGSTDFPTNWGGDNKPMDQNRGFSPNWAAANWGNASGQGAQPQPPQQPKPGPINPFTGASNLTQLNTSPWPTTGTSPVQNASSTASASMASAWPTTNNAPVPPMASNSTTASNAGFFGMNQNQSNDPFGAAPATNLQKNGKFLKKFWVIWWFLKKLLPFFLN